MRINKNQYWLLCISVPLCDLCNVWILIMWYLISNWSLLCDITHFKFTCQKIPNLAFLFLSCLQFSILWILPIKITKPDSPLRQPEHSSLFSSYNTQTSGRLTLAGLLSKCRDELVADAESRQILVKISTCPSTCRWTSPNTPKAPPPPF